MKKKTIALCAAAAALALSMGCVTAFASESSDAFSYLTGRQRSTERNELYAQAAELPEDEQSAFLAEKGIADTAYSDEAAASYSYVAGQQVGSQYEDDTEDKTGYSYITGQEIGPSYAPKAEDESAYSYVTGQQSSTARNDLYAKAQELPEDEQDAFLAENGVGDTAYSEEAAAAYSYVTGQQRGSQYENDAETKSGYSYVTGQQRGNSYHK